MDDSLFGSGGVQLLIVVAVVIGVIVRRTYGEPVQARRLFVLPPILLVLGVIDLGDAHVHHVSATTVALLVGGGVIGLLTGVARGATVNLFTRRGYLWQRYSWLTIVLWVVLTPLHLLLEHATDPVARISEHSLFLSLGISLLGEAATVAPRALRLGVPFAPRNATGLRGVLTGAVPTPVGARRTGAAPTATSVRSGPFGGTSGFGRRRGSKLDLVLQLADEVARRRRR